MAQKDPLQYLALRAIPSPYVPCQPKMACLVRLALFVMSVVALEDCHVDSGAPMAKQLLQRTMTRNALKIDSVERQRQHIGNLDALKNLADFWELGVLQGALLSQEQLQIVRELNRTFYEETLPTLFERHQNDVLLNLGILKKFALR